MKNSKTFVLIHGAWYGSWAWEKVSEYLKNKGHDVYTLDLPYYDENSREPITLEKYVQKVEECVFDPKKNIKNPILVGHSMAGIILSQFEANNPNVAEKLIYLAAFVIPHGQSICSSVLEKREDEKTHGIGAVKIPADYNDNPNLQVYYKDLNYLQERFFQNHRINDIELLELKQKFDKPNPRTPLANTLDLKGNHNFYRNPKMFYISCLQDKATNIKERKMMLSQVQFRKDHIIEIKDADHSPFFSMPDTLGKILHEISLNKILNKIPNNSTDSMKIQSPNIQQKANKSKQIRNLSSDFFLKRWLTQFLFFYGN